MKVRNTIKTQRPEAGIALLISIFILLLLSVVAIALIVSSGTESALAGNYRSSTGVYYAALSGLEEARGRLLPKSPSSFKNTAGSFLPAPGAPLPIGSVAYVINPVGSETIAPSDPSSTYPDTQYDTEFGPGALAGATVTTTNSVWNISPLDSLSVPGPPYKWVRINAVSEKSLNVDVDSVGGANSTTPLYYDGAHFSNNSTVGPQVFEITSYAVLPNGSQKLLQYLVTRSNLNLNFPAALTLDGPIGTFGSSKSSNFWMSGIDQQHGGNCPPALADGPKPAIGVTSPSYINDVTNGIPPYSTSPNLYHFDHYVSSSPHPTNPGVDDISSALSSVFQTVSSLDNVSPPGLVQALSASGVADHVLNGPLTSLPEYGSPTQMVTTVVTGPNPGDGDLTLSGNLDGYGLLVVTGNLTIGGNVAWHGVILVIGQGNMFLSSTGFAEIDGAVLIARTRHANYSLQSTLHNVTFDISDSDDYNHGFWYNSCWVQAAMPAATYKILAFHEISQ